MKKKTQLLTLLSLGLISISSFTIFFAYNAKITKNQENNSYNSQIISYKEKMVSSNGNFVCNCKIFLGEHFAFQHDNQAKLVINNLFAKSLNNEKLSDKEINLLESLLKRK